MGISSFYTKTFSLYRQSYTGNKSAYALVGTILCHLQQISPDEQAQLGLNYTTPYRLWCAPSTDIQIGDELSDGTDLFTVKGVQNNSFVGDNQHIEALLETAFLSESV